MTGLPRGDEYRKENFKIVPGGITFKNIESMLKARLFFILFYEVEYEIYIMQGY